MAWHLWGTSGGTLYIHHPWSHEAISSVPENVEDRGPEMVLLSGAGDTTGLPSGDKTASLVAAEGTIKKSWVLFPISVYFRHHT